MTGALPDPLLLAAVVFGLTGVYALYAAACCACRWSIQARRDSKAPVPGNATPSPMVAAPRPPRLRQPPAPGCALCGFYTAWDDVLHCYVERYEKCPAHQEVSR